MIEQKKLEYLAVGPASWDTNILTGVNSLSRLEGVRHVDGKIIEQPGGTAINFAYALKSFCDEIAVCGVTGFDQVGAHTKQQISQHGINTTYLRQDLVKTPRSISCVTMDGKKHILNDSSGLNDYVYPEEEFRSIVTQTPWAYFSIAKFSKYLLPIAREMNVKIATDIQTPTVFYSKYDTHLRFADIVFCSDAQIKLSISNIIKSIWSYGPSIVLITHGKKGVTLGLRQNNYVQYYKAIPAQQVLDTTGAGDNFAGAFCGCLSHGLSIEESLLKALIFSSKKVAQQGSLSRQIPKKELNELYKDLLKSKL